MSYANNLSPEEVNDPDTLARFCQEQTGIPYPTGKQMAFLKTSIRKFFEAYPEATYVSLTNLVQWSKVKNRRYAHIANLINGGLRYAYIDGYVPEIDPRTKRGNIDALIDDALRIEQNPVKRIALMGPWTQAAKEAAYTSWLKEKEKESA
jgi:hypothetical protein